jgi:hypothetical protein
MENFLVSLNRINGPHLQAAIAKIWRVFLKAKFLALRGFVLVAGYALRHVGNAPVTAAVQNEQAAKNSVTHKASKISCLISAPWANVNEGDMYGAS